PHDEQWRGHGSPVPTAHHLVERTAAVPAGALLPLRRPAPDRRRRPRRRAPRCARSRHPLRVRPEPGVRLAAPAGLAPGPAAALSLIPLAPLSPPPARLPRRGDRRER